MALAPFSPRLSALIETAKGSEEFSISCLRVRYPAPLQICGELRVAQTKWITYETTILNEPLVWIGILKLPSGPVVPVATNSSPE